MAKKKWSRIEVHLFDDEGAEHALSDTLTDEYLTDPTIEDVGAAAVMLVEHIDIIDRCGDDQTRRSQLMSESVARRYARGTK